MNYIDKKVNKLFYWKFRVSLVVLWSEDCRVDASQWVIQ